MINKKSIQAVEASKFSDQFRLPLYSSYCFFQIPATIEALFSGERQKGLPLDTTLPGPFDHVILLFIDGFGWRFFDKFKSKLAALQKFEENGIASKLTSMFPSTTAAHVTCINTGLTPNQSGIYEWFIYEPKLNDIIAPLPFSYAGDRDLGTLPLDPKEIFPQKTLYHRLNERGIQCNVFQSASLINSPYSLSVLDGAKAFGYKRNVSQAFEKMISLLQGKTYSYFYYGEIDAVGHRKGIHSNEFTEAIEKVFGEIDTLINSLPPKTALILTADHGMTEVDPKKTFYLNKKLPSIDKYLLFGRRNKPLAPAGSCRDFFLHVRPERLSELKELLEIILKGKAEVYKTEDLIKAQLFGIGQPSDNFLSRVGNLVILPYQEEAIWWYERNRFQQNFYGAHGGLTKEEMDIPFLFYKT